MTDLTPRFPQLAGLFTAILTPFEATGEVAYSGLPELLHWQKQSGIDGVVVSGTNGEGTSLSVEERNRLVDAALAANTGLKIIAGTGAASVKDAVVLTKHAAAAGADAALVLPPFFFKQTTEAGIVDYFERVLDAANIPMLLYHIPQFSMVPITNTVIEQLQHHPNLAGLKDSTGNWEGTVQYVNTFPHLLVFAGNDHLTHRITAAGGAGSISGTANSFPELVANVRRLYLTGDINGSRNAQRILDEVMAILQEFPPFAVNKSVIAMRGKPVYSVRPPIKNLTEEQLNHLRSRLEPYLSAVLQDS